MAVLRHADYQVQSGDTWAIGGQLQNLDGSPLDVTGSTIQWILLAPDGAPALTQDQYTLDVEDPPTMGRIIIMLDASVTATFEAGRYTDALRIVAPSGRMATLWEGFFDINANPFYALLD